MSKINKLISELNEADKQVRILPVYRNIVNNINQLKSHVDLLSKYFTTDTDMMSKSPKEHVGKNLQVLTSKGNSKGIDLFKIDKTLEDLVMQMVDLDYAIDKASDSMDMDNE